MKPLALKNLNRPIQVARDAQGVPHVRAATWHDALYGLGYMHALDRPTQMLFSRTVAQGRAAEQIGNTPDLLDADRFFRRVALFRNLAREEANLEPEARDQLDAYCAGVNDSLTAQRRSLPMWATGFQREPWNLRAVMLIGNLLNFGGLAVGQQQNERILLELIQAGVDPEGLREMFGDRLDGADIELLKRVHVARQLSDDAFELLIDLPRLIGSNAWAVSGRRSVSGHPLLASDPHLEVNRLPAIWYEAALRFGDEYVLGASLPGTPLFGVGRTARLAWGVTYLKGDTSDYFIEDCRRGPQGWQYRRAEEWREFQVRTETIQRKGAEPETLHVYENPLGTLDADLERTGEGLFLNTAWTGDHEGAGRSLAVWLRLVHCHDALSAMVVVRDLPQPTLMWVLADTQGNIGRQASGWFPRRGSGTSGLFPVPAWDEANHWRGWEPAEQLPGVLNPPEGFVSSANEDAPAEVGLRLCSQPLPDYRKRRIDEVLRGLPLATPADMQRLQYDVVSTQARDLLKIFLPHLPPGPIRDQLSAWDGSYSPRSHEATLFTLLYRNVLLEIFGRAPRGIGWRRMLYLVSRAGFSMMIVTVIDRVLAREDSVWWQGRNKGELIARAAAALANAEPQPWSDINAFHFTNRFLESRFVGRALGFHTGAYPMPGCHATPFQGHLFRAARRESTFAPSYHFVTDLGTDEAWTNLPGGPSESRFSRYYKSDLELWLHAQYKRLSPPPTQDASHPGARPA